MTLPTEFKAPLRRGFFLVFWPPPPVEVHCTGSREMLMADWDYKVMALPRHFTVNGGSLAVQVYPSV